MQWLKVLFLALLVKETAQESVHEQFFTIGQVFLVVNQSVPKRAQDSLPLLHVVGPFIFGEETNDFPREHETALCVVVILAIIDELAFAVGCEVPQKVLFMLALSGKSPRNEPVLFMLIEPSLIFAFG